MWTNDRRDQARELCEMSRPLFLNDGFSAPLAYDCMFFFNICGIYMKYGDDIPFLIWIIRVYTYIHIYIYINQISGPMKRAWTRTGSATELLASRFFCFATWTWHSFESYSARPGQLRFTCLSGVWQKMEAPRSYNAAHCAQCTLWWTFT